MTLALSPSPSLNLSHLFADRPLLADDAPPGPLRSAVHGLAVEVQVDDPALSAVADAARRQFAPFDVTDFPPGFAPLAGSVEPFDPAVVHRHLSTAAVRFPTAAAGPMADLFHDPADPDRFWLVDDRWGLAELHLLRGRWRAWVLPRPTLDADLVAEAAVLWPVAQLMRSKGLHLLPAVSVVRDGWAALILSPVGIEPELALLLDSGYALIGQRWTAVREEDGRLALLHLPGWVDRQPAPRLRQFGTEATDTRVDLTAGRPGAVAHHAFCSAVLIVEPGRRPAAHLRDLPAAAATNMLRRAWPIVDLQPERKAVQLSRRVPTRCRCCELQLGRDPAELLRLLDGVRPRSNRV